jgi:hypothetical protein
MKWLWEEKYFFNIKKNAPRRKKISIGTNKWQEGSLIIMPAVYYVNYKALAREIVRVFPWRTLEEKANQEITFVVLPSAGCYEVFGYWRTGRAKCQPQAKVKKTE